MSVIFSVFSFYAEVTVIEAMQDMDEGIKVGRELLKDENLADDQGMVASTEKGLQRLVDSLNDTAKKYDMKINVKKTKALVVSKEVRGKVKIVMDGQLVEQVEMFKYLGAMISEEGKSEKDVKIRTGMSKNAFGKQKALLNSRMS
jgi:hypothetical protein